jgi:ATP-dependent exoDNAse (exonuclease V) beta subunit
MPHDDRSDDAPAPIDPRGLGSLVHAVLERVDLQADNPVGTWCEQLAEEHVVENTEAAAEAARKMVERFTRSARWRALAEAAVAHRELEFLLAWPPGPQKGVRTLFQESGMTESLSRCSPKKSSDPFLPRYLQGYIDCLYQDQQGDWHLVDYKTNNVTADACSQAARQYEMQLYVYAMAVERALGREPVELVLHFLRPGVEHVVAWDDAARRRGMELVSNAIDRAVSLNPDP